MNKTIIININGIVFHIEEDAYEVLRSYMTDVKRHFAYTAGSEEIVSDIENRIAEMFQELLEQSKKQVIVLADVQQITARMGAVDDFSEEGSEDYPETGTRVDKKLFRDLDDRIIGGVCSGIAHYFNVEPRWVRLLAILIVFLGGSGILIYAILWVVMPKAITRADRMAMKGEMPNIQNFKKNFDEEIEGIRQNLPDAGNGLENFFREFFLFLGKLLKGLAKLIGGLIILEGILVLIALIIGLFVLLGWGTTNLNILPFIAINPQYRIVLYVSAFLIAIVPVAALVLFAIRVVFDKKVINRTGSFILLIIWIFGLAMGAFYGTRLAAEFKEEASFSQTLDLNPSPVYYLRVSNQKYLSREDSLQYNIGSNGKDGNIVINNNDEFDNFNRMSLFIERSDVDKPTLIKTYSAMGPNFDAGLDLARRINYTFLQKDSVLLFDSKVHIRRNDLWRDQDVKLVLQVPLNARLIIDEDLDWNLRNLDLSSCRPEGASWDTPTEWIMTAEGLRCKNPPVKEENDDDSF